MNTKRFFALLLTLVLVFSLVLLTPTETKAEGFESDSTEIAVDPYWDTLFLEWNDPDTGTVKITDFQMSPMDDLYTDDVGTYAYTASGHSDETCTEPEKTVYTVSFSYGGRSYSASNTYLGEPALGHDWTDWVNNGDTHYRLCQREGCGAREEVAHTYGNWTYVDDSTCKGVCVCGAEKTEAHYDQFETKCAHQPHCEKCGRDYGTIPEHRMWYEYKDETYHNPNCFDCDTDFPLEAHSGGTATCTSSPICEKCGHEYGSPDPDAHDWGDWEYLNETQHQRKCRRNGCTATEAEDHSGGKATCTEKAKCEICGQEYGAPLGHDLIDHPAQAPTCTAIGWDAYQTCSRCDYTTYVEKAALGHTEVIDPAKAPTCTATGLTEGKHCSVCNTVLTAQQVVPALGHDWVIDEAVAPTCAKTGLTEGKHCSRCDALAEQAELPALGHTPGEAVKENEAAPQVGVEGSYDKVVYCTVCHEELSRETVNVPALPDPFTQFSMNVAHRIRTAPENGMVEADAAYLSSLHRIVLQALAERPDVTLSITCCLKGQPPQLTIPAGTDLLTPLGIRKMMTFKEIGELLGQS